MKKGMDITTAVLASLAIADSMRNIESIVTYNMVVQNHNGMNIGQGMLLIEKISNMKIVFAMTACTQLMMENGMMYAHSLYNASEVSFFITLLSDICFGMPFIPSMDTDIINMKKNGNCPLAPLVPMSK
mmetsp:Transcript_26910/g.78005  ORF Transcript_26910/g.78005 Transcript_26910/m.78005 type:complete len:129 (+) Transcript_26910:680-1066(+)